MKGFIPGDTRARLAGQKGGQIRGEQKKRESIERLEAEFPGVPVDLIYRIRKMGYQAGYMAGVKAASVRRKVA